MIRPEGEAAFPLAYNEDFPLPYKGQVPYKHKKQFQKYELSFQEVGNELDWFEKKGNRFRHILTADGNFYVNDIKNVGTQDSITSLSPKVIANYQELLKLRRDEKFRWKELIKNLSRRTDHSLAKYIRLQEAKEREERGLKAKGEQPKRTVALSKKKREQLIEEYVKLAARKTQDTELERVVKRTYRTITPQLLVEHRLRFLRELEDHPKAGQVAKAYERAFEEAWRNVHRLRRLF